MSAISAKLLISRPVIRIGALLILFFGLTSLGIWWAAPSPTLLRESWHQLAGLSWPTLAVLGGMSVGLFGAQMQRVIVFGRALGVRIGFRAALDATIADNFFSWITPGAFLGDPITIYMLRRNGVPVDVGAVIAFGEFATGFAFIMGLASLLVALGFGPAISPWVGASFAGAVGFAALVMFVLVVGAFWPEATIARVRRASAALLGTRLLSRPRLGRILRAVVEGVCGSVERLAQFRRAGAPGSLALLISHIVYYGTFVGIFVVLAVAFGAPSWIAVVPIAIIYQAFLYIVPTPGGAGIGEASAAVFFGKFLPGGKALAVVILFRMLTFYLHVLVGLIYLPLTGSLARKDPP